MENYLFQPLDNYTINFPNIELQTIEDEIRIINNINKALGIKIEWPFNGSILLALTFFYISRNKNLMKLLIGYQCIWLIIIPLAVLPIINGNIIITILYNIHLKIYKMIFLFLGLLSIRQFYISSSS